jgi:ABC-type glycerol-3-phosphate transport system permease component
MFLVTLYVMFPYFWMVFTSLKPREEASLSPTVFTVSHLEFKNYITVWATLPLLRYLRNSLFISVMTTIISSFVAALCGYSISRFSKQKLQRFTLTLLLLSQLIPSVLPIVALYFLMRNIGLLNSFAGLILTNVSWTIPFCTLMSKSYFDSAVPNSLDESATIDGCTRWGVFTRIAIPLGIPGLVATGIFAFINSWNEFMWASIMIANNQIKPVSVGMYDYIGQYGVNVNLTMTMTTAVIVTLPTMILFAFFQRYLVSGLSVGAVKE